MLQLTEKETATVLAALRQWQEENRHNLDELKGTMFFEDYDPLTYAEIDDLCERINLA